MVALIQGFHAFQHDQNDTEYDRNDDHQIEDLAFFAVGFIDDFVQGCSPVAIRLLSFQMRSIFHKYRNFSEPDYPLDLVPGKIFFDDYILVLVIEGGMYKILEYVAIGYLVPEFGIAISLILVFFNENH